MTRNRETALAEARSLRTAPPPDIPTAPDQGAHLPPYQDRCHHCEPTAAAAGLGRILAEMPTGPSAGRFESSPTAGQFRFIRPERGGWRGEWHLNPPLVLVLEGSEAGVLVAQSYPDPILAGPGDLILRPEWTGLDELFVEGWNTYRVSPADLGPAVGQAPPTISAAVRRLQTDPSDYPPWALRPRPLTVDDPRTEFRRLEREVAACFSVEVTGKARPMPTVKNALAPPEAALAGIREPIAEYGQAKTEPARDAELQAVILPRWREAMAWTAGRGPAGELVLCPLPHPPDWRPVDGVWHVKGCAGHRRKGVGDALLVDPSGRVEHARAVGWDPAAPCFRAEFDAPPAGRRLVVLPAEETEENG